MTDYELAGRQWAEAQRKSRPIPSWFTTAEAQRGADAERELNIPAGAGARLPEVDNILEQQRLRRRLEMAPKLRAFMDDAINASLAKDDTENLTAIERGGKAFVDVNVKAASEFAKGALNIAGAAPRLSASAYARTGMLASMTEEEALATLFPEADRKALQARGAYADIASREAEILRQHRAAKQSVELGIDPAKGVVSSLEAAGAIERTRRSLKGFEWADEFARKHYAAAEKEPTLGRQARRLLEGFLEDPAGGFVFLQTVTLQSAPSLVAAGGTMLATGNPALASMVMGAGSASAEYTGEHTKFLNDNGIDIATEEGRLRLLSSPELLREADRRGLAKGLVVGMIDTISGGVASKKLLSGPVGNAIAQMFVQGFLGGAGEGLGDLAAGNDLNAASMAMEVLAEVSGVFVEVPMMAGRKAFTRDTVRAEKAGEARAVLEPLGEAATKSKLKERARDRFMAFLEKTDWQDVDIYIDANELNTFFQAKDSVPGDYGLDVETFNEAVLSGNDVAIPATLYADKIAGTEDAEFFLANGRFSSEAMSEAEAARFNELIREESEKEGERIEAELRADLEARASDIQVRDAMYEQFRAAGRSPDAAEREASLWQAFFRTQAERYGEDPLELARMFGVRVEGPTNARSRIRDNFDIAINTLRARRTKPVKPKQEAMRQNRAARDEWKASEKRQGEIALDAQGKIDALIAAGHDLSSSPEINAELDRIKEAREATDQLRQAWRDVVDANEAVIYGTEGDPNVAAAPEEGAVITPEDDLAPIMEELDRLGLTLDMTNDEIAEAMGIGEFAGEGTLFQNRLTDLKTAASEIANDLGIEIVISAGQDVAIISKISVPDAARGQGVAREAMDRLVKVSDETGVSLALTPTSEFGASKSRLVKFYKSLGFVENKGRGRIFSVSEEMYREATGKTLYQQQTPEQFLTSDGEWRNQDVTVQDEDGNNVDVPAGLAADVLMERLEQARQILRCVNAG